MVEAIRIINEELNNIRSAKKISETNMYICCPFHGERTPSLGIYLVEGGKLPYGSFHCFGCGISGTWNKLASELGLRKVSNEDYKQTTTSSNKRELEKTRERLLNNKEEIELPFGVPFKEKEWRGIDGKLMNDLGCIISFDPKERISQVIIPIKVRDKLVTFIKARFKKKKNKSSYILDNNVSVKSQGLFPYDYVKSMLENNSYKGLVLVEGPRDALFLIERGIPALAILGTNMWGSEKRRLVNRLLSKYDLTLYIMMDADTIKNNGIKPGQQAQKKIYKSYKNDIYQVKKINLEKIAYSLGLKELDPATLPNSIIKKVRRLVQTA